MTSCSKKAKTTEVCGGNLSAKVEAYDEPYFGGASAALKVEYFCDRCKLLSNGQVILPELPDCYTISEFMTEIIRNMTTEVRDDLRVAYTQRENEADERRRAFVEARN